MAGINQPFNQPFALFFYIMNQTKDIFNALGKAAIETIGGIIPIVGFVDSFYDNLNYIQAERKQKRVTDFVIQLSEDLKELKDSIQEDYVSNDEFLDVFEKASRYIANERTEQKRTFFKNILCKSMISKDCDYDKTERYFRLLDNLSDIELSILAVLENPEEYNKKHGMIIIDPVNSYYQTIWNQADTGGLLTKLLGLKIDDVSEAITVLFSNGLLIENVLQKAIRTNGNTIHVLDNLLTRKGRDFVRFLRA